LGKKNLKEEVLGREKKTFPTQTRGTCPRRLALEDVLVNVFK